MLDAALAPPTLDARCGSILQAFTHRAATLSALLLLQGRDQGETSIIRKGTSVRLCVRLGATGQET